MADKKRVAMIASGGTLDAAYKVLNIATVAAASDAEVSIFFTFEGLNIIHRQASAALSMPSHLQGYQEKFRSAGSPSIPDLLEMARESGVRMIACQMTMDIMDIAKEDLIDGVETAGAVTFLDEAFQADTTVSF